MTGDYVTSISASVAETSASEVSGYRKDGNRLGNCGNCGYCGADCRSGLCI